MGEEDSNRDQKKGIVANLAATAKFNAGLDHLDVVRAEGALDALHYATAANCLFSFVSSDCLPLHPSLTPCCSEVFVSFLYPEVTEGQERRVRKSRAKETYPDCARCCQVVPSTSYNHVCTLDALLIDGHASDISCEANLEEMQQYIKELHCGQ
jgi:hypothetical protein